MRLDRDVVWPRDHRPRVEMACEVAEERLEQRPMLGRREIAEAIERIGRLGGCGTADVRCLALPEELTEPSHSARYRTNGHRTWRGLPHDRLGIAREPGVDLDGEDRDPEREHERSGSAPRVLVLRKLVRKRAAAERC